MTAQIIPFSFQNTKFEIVDHNSQPWLRATQIGTALEYAHADTAIRKIFNRNKDEFTETMTAVVKLTTPSGIQETRIFSLRGAHLIAMFAKTKVAKLFRSWALDTLEAVSKKEAPNQATQTLTPAQKSHIKSAVAERCKSNSEDYQTTYSKMNNHFRVAKYDEIPAKRYFEVCKYLGVAPLEGELLEPEQQLAPIDVRKLLLENLSTTNLPFTSELHNAIDKQAVSLALEAYELCREHLKRRVAYECVSGDPRKVNVTKALKVIGRGDLGDALAHTFHTRISGIETSAYIAMTISAQYYKEIQEMCNATTASLMPSKKLA